MKWLLLVFALELGFAPYYGSLNVISSEEVKGKVDENIFYTTLEAEVLIGELVFVGGAVKTYIQKGEGICFIPVEADYLFNVGLRYKILEIGFRHLCLHSVRTCGIYIEPIESTFAGYDEFYFRISTKK